MDAAGAGVICCRESEDPGIVTHPRKNVAAPEEEEEDVLLTHGRAFGSARVRTGGRWLAHSVYIGKAVVCRAIRCTGGCWTAKVGVGDTKG